jgi:hypothetical protein
MTYNNLVEKYGQDNVASTSGDGGPSIGGIFVGVAIHGHREDKIEYYKADPINGTNRDNWNQLDTARLRPAMPTNNIQADLAHRLPKGPQELAEEFASWQD